MPSNPKFTQQGMRKHISPCKPALLKMMLFPPSPVISAGMAFSRSRKEGLSHGRPHVEYPRCKTYSVHWQSLASTKRRRLSWRWPGGLVGWLVGCGWVGVPVASACRLGWRSQGVHLLVIFGWLYYGNHHHHNHPSCHGLGEFLGESNKTHLWSLSNFRWEDPRFAKMTQNHLKSKMTRRIEYILGCPPSQDACGKWRFRLGFPTKNVIILVVTLTGRGDNPKYIEWIYKTDFFINFLNSWIFLASVRVQDLNPPRKMVRFRQGKKPRDFSQLPKTEDPVHHGSGWVKWYVSFNTQMLLVWNIYLYFTMILRSLRQM